MKTQTAALPVLDETHFSAPSLTGRLKKPVLFELASEGRAGFFLTFGGQSAGYVDELRALLRRAPAVRPLIETAARVLAEESRHPEIVAAALYPEGADLMKWLADAKTAPSAADFAGAALSQPLIFVTQMAHYFHLTEYGCDAETLLAHARGASGHSQGIMAAVLAGLGADKNRFLETFAAMTRWFVWQALRMQQSFPRTDVPQALLQECERGGFGTPSPMAVVAGLKKEELSADIASVNAALPAGRHVFLSLSNGFKKLVVSGSPEGLVLLRRRLGRKEESARKRPETRLNVRFEFLAVTSAYHTPHMSEGLERFRSDLGRVGLNVSAGDLKIPVHAPDDGRDLRNSPDLVEDLVNMQFLRPVDWERATAAISRSGGVTHVIDFGPGDMVAKLTASNREGEGIPVFPYATEPGKNHVLSADGSKLPATPKAWKDYAPELVTLPDGTSALTNAYVRFTGLPPIFGGGMTPTTVEPDLVVTAANGGVLVEWAGGGQVTEAVLRKRLDEITGQLEPGRGVVFNALYLDSYLWNLQYPLLLKLKDEGYPIDGVTISAGVPTREAAKDILAAFTRHGLWLNSFKPGSDEQIKSVLEIADDHPDMTLIVQIEGGKAGGHHSWEDLNGLLERNYAAIRRRENVILAVGGGIGLESEAVSYLTGAWHESGRLMPVDGVFIGTRLMACREAKTSPQIKELLAAISGTEDWVGRGEFRAGLNSGQSQLGADVHYADNPASRTANFIDAISTAGESEIAARKGEIVAALNRTAKPYFGDLEDMTYGQVLTRMIELMAPGNMPAHFIHDEPWFDATYRSRAFDFLTRAIARLTADPAAVIELFSSAKILNDPRGALDKLIETVPAILTAPLDPEDADYFLELCRRPGKPVNFVPVIDKGIKRWFKSDSLWQSHDPRYSAEEVLAIPGIRAVKGINKVDEPVTEVFGNFIRETMKALESGGKHSEIRAPFAGAGTFSPSENVPHGVERSVFNETLVELKIRDARVDPRSWMRSLAAQGGGAISALLSSPRILEGRVKRANPFPQILFPETGITARLELIAGDIVSLSLSDRDGKAVLDIRLGKEGAKNSSILVTLHHEAADGRVLPLSLNCSYRPGFSQAPIRLEENGLKSAVNALYRDLWLGGEPVPANATESGMWGIFSEDVVITPDAVKNFLAATDNRSTEPARGFVPAAASIALLWRPLARCLTDQSLDLHLLKLLHLSHEFEAVSPEPLKIGAPAKATSRVVEIKNAKEGRTITVEGIILKSGVPVIRMTSRFLVRERADHLEPRHESRFDASYALRLTQVSRHILRHKTWFKGTAELPLDETLTARIRGFDRVNADGSRDYRVEGDVTRGTARLGTIDLTDTASRNLKNPVRYFLERHAGTEIGARTQDEGLSLETPLPAPARNEAYSLASLDLNPIHTDQRLAALAGLPAGTDGKAVTIVHGMRTAAAALAAVSRRFEGPVKRWKTDFLGMVPPATVLSLAATHAGNVSGRIAVDVKISDGSGATVLSGRGEFAQKPTAYLFTGQGSQAKGMGMAAYEGSKAARAVWDRAEAYCRGELGFSILEIVRDNPKETFVRGHRVFHPQGVLNLTQFAQVGLTVLAMAQVEELKSAGLYAEDALFAGHSLGEYAALSSCGIIPFESVLRVVYQRGLTMQDFVPRDADGKSPYGMIVVRPNVAKLSEDGLVKTVAAIADRSPSGEIHLVNYNVEGMQYAVTGRLELLDALTRELRKLEAKSQASKSSFVRIEGVDVPFHSPILTPGVAAFRRTLKDTIPADLDPKILVGRYIPNVTAELFALGREAVEKAFRATESPVLKEVLADWESRAADEPGLARTLLIELLAYQFASPVRWIETQKAVLAHEPHAAKRVIEIGPSPVLANMLKATLARAEIALPPEIIHLDSERDAAFYRVHVPNAPSQAAPDVEAPARNDNPVPKPVAMPSSAAAAPADRPFSVARGLRALLALKLNVRPDEIRDEDTLEALSGGNSARRNEILSEIGSEFRVGAVDDAHQLPFPALVQAIAAKADYIAPGPFLQKAVERALKEKFALGRKDVTDHLSGERLLGEGLTRAILVQAALAARAGASSRSGALSEAGISERVTERAASLKWIDELADRFAAAEGFAIPYRSLAGATAGAALNAEALDNFERKYFGPRGPFASWAKDFLALAAPQSPGNATEPGDDRHLKLYRDAFGPATEKVISPLFDPVKRVSFTSAWNWARRDLVRLGFEKLRTGAPLPDAEAAPLIARGTPEMAKTAAYFAGLAERKGHAGLARRFQRLECELHLAASLPPAYKPAAGSFKPEMTFDADGRPQYGESPRSGLGSPSAVLNELVAKGHLKAQENVLAALRGVVTGGLNLSGKTVLVTGASPGSIAWEAAKNALSAGATVIATTSTYGGERLDEFRGMYQERAVSGAALHVIPFSQGSKSDVDALVKWCFANGHIPDVTIPFAAVSESATLALMTPDASTATLRVLLQGVEWLLAAIAKNFSAINAKDRACVAILPLSPNHGHFGGDGAYADAKLGLESILNRWHAEHAEWGRFVSLIGADIGWVRGTGLMHANNALAAVMEERAGVRTFSSAEAGWLIASLCHPDLAAEASLKPLRLDFTGGFAEVTDLSGLASKARQEWDGKARFIREVRQEENAEKAVLYCETKPSMTVTPKTPPFSLFPTLPRSRHESRHKPDPAKTVVVVGYGEISPFGFSAPRFEMECRGRLTQNGAIELAWLMGLIRYEDGTGKSSRTGWVDAKTGEAVPDDAVWSRYKETILAGTGVRFTDPEVQKFDPRGVVVFGDAVLEAPLSFSVESREAADGHAAQYGAAARIEAEGPGGFRVTIEAGSLVKIPRRVPLTRWVAGQIPKGFDPVRLGLPKELAGQIDRNTQYNLVASASAFLSAGLTPEELAENVHPARIGNSQGGGMGGMTALTKVYHDLREDRPRQGDALQETLINVGPAWVNQSYVGGYGPMVNPVAACATALVSFSVGADLIGQGKADFVVAGGYDDYGEEGVVGFQDMAATCGTEDMLKRGIEPNRMSRPNDARRGGFVEAQGGGTLLLTSLAKALEMGLPIYAVVGFATNYSDGIQTSIPAPGSGLLGMAAGGGISPLARALAEFGLEADDIRVVSKHDTSTAVNDPNENKIHHLIQEKLGRRPGNPLLVHSQKAALGHAKGGAGAWQAIAAIQMLQTGIVPGNRNLEDVDPAMKEFGTLCFSDDAISLGGGEIPAVLMTSLGFGHVGAVTLFIHPDAVLAGLADGEYSAYARKRALRENAHVKRRRRVLTGKEPLYRKRADRMNPPEEIGMLLDGAKGVSP